MIHIKLNLLKDISTCTMIICIILSLRIQCPYCSPLLPVNEWRFFLFYVYNMLQMNIWMGGGRHMAKKFLHNACLQYRNLKFNKIIYQISIQITLTRRRHDMGNSLGDETSCGSSTPLTYSTPNVLVPNGQWVLRKMPLKFYTLLMWYLAQKPPSSTLA